MVAVAIYLSYFFVAILVFLRSLIYDFDFNVSFYKHIVIVLDNPTII